MAVDPSVRIDIAAEFVGKKAFQQADKSTDQLTKSVKKLAGAFGIAFSARAVTNFAKQSVKAFAEDDAAITVLRQNLKNLGLAYQATNAEDFIAKLEEQSAIFDDKLRPAYARLAKITMSTAKTQELMALGVDVARSNGVDFETVINTLAKAYIGNYKGLKQLNIGLSDAELKTKSFAEIQAILIRQSQGAGKAYIDTFAGSIDKLAVASANAKEVIGEGLVDLFADLAGNGDINKATDNINTLAKAVSDLLKDANKLGFLDYLGVFFTGSITQETFDKLNVKPGGAATDSQNTARLIADKKALAAAKAAAAQAAKAATLAKLTAASKIRGEKLAAAAKKKADIASAALAKAAAVFDLNKIQIAAALKATFDKDERLRLLAMQEIENDNGETALKYIEQLKLLTAEQQTNKLAGIKSISESELNYINQLLLDELQRIKTTKMSEEEAALARQAAYAKYNAAIAESGGLAEANFYTEKTQVELLSIAKLAALDTVAAAQATIDLLNYTTQTDIIARIAAAQKLADDAKYKALQDYLAEATKPITQIVTTQHVIIGAPPTAVIPGAPPTAVIPGAPPTAVIPGAPPTAVIPGAPPTAAIPGAPPVVSDPPSTNTGPKFGPGGQPYYSDGYNPGYNTGQGTGSSDNSVTIIVEGSVLNGNDFVEIVNDALLDANRQGLSQFPAGFVPG